MNQFDKIYNVVSSIPKGRVMTYQQVANLAGLLNPRVVGFALSVNNDQKRVPCHRVVSSNGKLLGYAFGGMEKKREILQSEGVVFLDNETVDLKNSAV